MFIEVASGGLINLRYATRVKCETPEDNNSDSEKMYMVSVFIEGEKMCLSVGTRGFTEGYYKRLLKALENVDQYIKV